MSSHERRHPRINARMSAIVRVLKTLADPKDSTETHSCKSGDISYGGVRLYLEKPIVEGTPLEVIIIFKSPPGHFKLYGHTRRSGSRTLSGQYMVGISFDGTPREVLDEWAAYLRAVFPQLPEESDQ